MAHEADSLTQWLRKHTEKQGDCLVFTGTIHNILKRKTHL